MPLSILSSVNRAAIARVVYRVTASTILQYTQTGGTVTTNSGYTVISYTNTAGGTLNFTSVPSTTRVYYLAVGGGGGGSCDFGGGAGGGAVTYGSFTISSATNLTITVGTGGDGKISTQGYGKNGGNSIISGSGITTITAGGGYTSGCYPFPTAVPTPSSVTFGGSGGGGGSGNSVGSPAGTYSGTADPRTYFNQGGSSVGWTPGGTGGGGGAGGAGSNGVGGTSGSGGDGKLYSSFSSDLTNYSVGINNVLATLSGTGNTPGSNLYLGAGGGGGGYGPSSLTAGLGGSNGAGGKGGTSPGARDASSNAVVFGGGGGGGAGGSGHGGNGYQGVVMLAFSNSRLLIPTDISPGPILWLDGFDPNATGTQPSNGSTLSTWKNKASTGATNDASCKVASTGAASTVTYWTTGFNNGYPGISFENTKCFTGTVSQTTDKMTFYGICRLDTGSTAAARIIGLGAAGSNDYNSSSYLGFLTQSNATFIAYRNGAIASPTGASFDTPYLWEFYFDGTKGYATYFNGGSTTTFASGTSTGNFNISAYALSANTLTSDTNGPMKGYISEIVLFNDALSQSNREKMEGCLSWKYGLQAKLPTDHPYKSSAPTITI